MAKKTSTKKSKLQLKKKEATLIQNTASKILSLIVFMDRMLTIRLSARRMKVCEIIIFKLS